MKRTTTPRPCPSWHTRKTRRHHARRTRRCPLPRLSLHYQRPPPYPTTFAQRHIVWEEDEKPQWTHPRPITMQQMLALACLLFWHPPSSLVQASASPCFFTYTSCWCANLGQKNGRLLPIIWPGHSTHILCGIISFYSGRINNIISQVLVAGICSLHMCPVSAKILRDKRASSFSFEGVVGLLPFLLVQRSRLVAGGNDDTAINTIFWLFMRGFIVVWIYEPM